VDAGDPPVQALHGVTAVLGSGFYKTCVIDGLAPRLSWSRCHPPSDEPSTRRSAPAPAARSCSTATAPGWTGTPPPAACGAWLKPPGYRSPGRTRTCSAIPSSLPVNRGMSLEAIAALLGHRSLDMTLRYIASRTVADEYFAVTEKVEALYGQPAQLPADAIGPKMTRLRPGHHRLLGNGWCTRPPQLDCAFEPICETCTYFQTSIEFRPALAAQHDHAAAATVRRPRPSPARQPSALPRGSISAARTTPATGPRRRGSQRPGIPGSSTGC
jgi:hypothetical protein